MFGKSLAKCIYNYPFLKLILQHTLQGWDDEEKKKPSAYQSSIIQYC